MRAIRLGEDTRVLEGDRLLRALDLSEAEQLTAERVADEAMDGDILAESVVEVEEEEAVAARGPRTMPLRTLMVSVSNSRWRRVLMTRCRGRRGGKRPAAPRARSKSVAKAI